MRVAEMIRELRCRRGESVAEFADFLGIPEQVLFSWEFGYITPSVWTVLLMARIVHDTELIALLLRDKKDCRRKPDRKAAGAKTQAAAWPKPDLIEDAGNIP